MKPQILLWKNKKAQSLRREDKMNEQKKKQESSLPDDTSGDMEDYFKNFESFRKNFVDRNMLPHILLKGKKKNQKRDIIGPEKI